MGEGEREEGGEEGGRERLQMDGKRRDGNKAERSSGSQVPRL